jgi:transcriptional regulator with XRE-family HTH domain
MDMTVAENLLLSTAQAHLDAIGMYIAYKRGVRLQTVIATRARVSPGTVSNLENGQHLVQKDNALAIMEAIGIEDSEQVYASYKSAYEMVERMEALVAA